MTKSPPRSADGSEGSPRKTCRNDRRKGDDEMIEQRRERVQYVCIPRRYHNPIHGDLIPAVRKGYRCPEKKNFPVLIDLGAPQHWHRQAAQFPRPTPSRIPMKGMRSRIKGAMAAKGDRVEAKSTDGTPSRLSSSFLRGRLPIFSRAASTLQG